VSRPPHDHDIAGEVAGVEFEGLSRWQLAALAVECCSEIIDRCSGDGSFERRIARLAADAENAADLIRRGLD